MYCIYLIVTCKNSKSKILLYLGTQNYFHGIISDLKVST